MNKFVLGITLLFCSMCTNAQTTKEWRDSISTLSKLIDLKPRDLELRMRKAECNIMLEQWKYALDEYSTILEYHPGHIGALYFRGYVNRKLRRYSFARLDYEEVLRFEPGHKGALTGLILTNTEDNHLLEAFDDANRLVELYPDDSEVLMTRADVEEVRGMNALALDDIDKAIDIERRKHEENKKHITIDDNISFYAMQKISLLKKTGDKKGIEATKKLMKQLGVRLP